MPLNVFLCYFGCNSEILMFLKSFVPLVKIFSHQRDNLQVMYLLLMSKSYTTAILSSTVYFLISVHNYERMYF